MPRAVWAVLDGVGLRPRAETGSTASGTTRGARDEIASAPTPNKLDTPRAVTV